VSFATEPQDFATLRVALSDRVGETVALQQSSDCRSVDRVDFEALVNDLIVGNTHTHTHTHTHPHTHTQGHVRHRMMRIVNIVHDTTTTITTMTTSLREHSLENRLYMNAYQ
jgi:hypothetical protein